MKRLLCALMTILLLLPGCGGGAEEERDRPLVYASIYPVYDFAAKVAGDRAEVRLLVPGGVEPHDWEPTPADIAGLSGADLLLYNGAGMEHWVDGVIASLPDDGPLLCETSAGILLLEDGHSHGGEDDHDEVDDHGEDGHSHGPNDPHVWLSPVNAKHQVQRISESLCRIDPDNAGYYSNNAEYWCAELDALDDTFHEALDAVPDKRIVTAHDAFGYLCAEYNIEQLSVRSFSPDSEPDPAALARVIDYVYEHDIQVIFHEAAESPGAAGTVARETGRRTGVLDPIEALDPARIEAGEDYISIMQDNLAALLEAFQ